MIGIQLLLILVPLIPPRRVGGFKKFKVFTDFSYLVKFSVAVAVAVTFINLCADASHVVGDVNIIIYFFLLLLLSMSFVC